MTGSKQQIGVVIRRLDVRLLATPKGNLEELEKHLEVVWRYLRQILANSRQLCCTVIALVRLVPDCIKVPIVRWSEALRRPFLSQAQWHDRLACPSWLHRSTSRAQTISNVFVPGVAWRSDHPKFARIVARHQHLHHST